MLLGKLVESRPLHFFAKYGDVKIQAGTEMTNQHRPWYLGMAFLFTLPLAVGGYDLHGQPRWRRPETSEPPILSTHLDTWLQRKAGLAHPKLPREHYAVGTAPKVRLFDLVRGLAQRIEGQFRRT